MFVFISSEYSIDSNEDEGQPLTQEELRQRAIKGVSTHCIIIILSIIVYSSTNVKFAKLSQF